jgi:hypothetical protein
MSFNGPYPIVFSANTTGMVISHTTFSGGVTNTGTIGSGGIVVTSSTFTAGGLAVGGVDTGGIKVDSHSKINAPIGITVNTIAAIAVGGSGSFGGGISNAGTLSGIGGIAAESIVSFGNGGAGGGITNSGVISASLFGIGILSLPHPVSTFTGGITNSGSPDHGAIGGRHPRQERRRLRQCGRWRRHHQQRRHLGGQCRHRCH